MRIRLRLTLIFTAALAGVIGVAGVGMVLTLRAQLSSGVDDALLSHAEVISAAYRIGETEVLEGSSFLERDEFFAQILGPTGRIEAASRRLEEPLLEDAKPTEEPVLADGNLKISGETLPVRLVSLGLAEGRVLVVGSSLEDLRDAVVTLSSIALFGGPLVIALGAWLVWSVTGAAFRPVEQLREEADALSISDAGRPLTVPESDDEISRLGKSLNALLARLDEALQRERRFVDDASHELRTPVTKLRSELELALTDSNTLEEMRSSVERALADADDLSQLTQDLLVLARADRGRLPIRRESVSLADLVEQVAAGFKQRALAGDLTIRTEVEGTYSADPLRLRQVLINLIDNALRHSPAGSSVWVTSVPSNEGLIVQVEDGGPGFDSEVLNAPFEPFARSNDERSQPGSAGLGLAIVRAIVDAHGGEVELQNRPEGGARVRVCIPEAGKD